jgi:predicted ribosomally synthesized peptide with nif11-like leader
MSLESARACVEKLNTDPSFGRSLVEAKDDDARKQMMQEAGFDFSKVEFEQVSGEGKRELSESELDSVAGGLAVTAAAVAAAAAPAAAPAAAGAIP